MNGPARLLAFVGPTLDSGPIVYADGDFADELAMGGYDMEDHEMPCADVPGLQVFEGWVEVGPGDDPDVRFVGSWRQLTHWEMCRVRFGLSPFGDAP